MFKGDLYKGQLFNGVLLNGPLGAVVGAGDSAQGQQSADGTGTLNAVTYLDGAGVGVGNRSWMKELVIDHRIRHVGVAKTAQPVQGMSAFGAVRIPLNIVGGVGFGVQTEQTVAAHGDNYDTDLENFALMIAALTEEEELWAA